MVILATVWAVSRLFRVALACVIPAMTGVSGQAAGQSPQSVPPPVTWRVEGGGSEFTLILRNAIRRIPGSAVQWNGTIVVDPADWTSARVDVTIGPAGGDMSGGLYQGNAAGGVAFSPARLPEATFRSVRVDRMGDDLSLAGNLTLNGYTKAVVMRGRVTGITAPDGGKRRLTLLVGTRLNPRDFGYGRTRAEAYATVSAEDVDVQLSIAAVEQ